MRNGTVWQECDECSNGREVACCVRCLCCKRHCTCETESIVTPEHSKHIEDSSREAD